LHASEFIAKWRKVELKERSAAQEHFLDLCRMLGHPTPAEADPTGETFCFEKGAEKHGGGDGFADVWKKDFFGLEYKGKHKDLDNAYNQLLLYRDALASPPILVACDLDRIVIHTNFTKTVSVAHEIPLERLGDPRSLEILRAVFFDPEKLRPGKTSVAITQEAAQHFADMAESMRKRGLDSAEVAHFLDRVVFCLFAEDIGLLPNQIFTRITEKSGGDPAKFARFIAQLFEAMAKGGEFGLETIRHFNGNLFDSATVPDLTADEVTRITASARLDWSAVEPSIFGTLFERGLDPAKRSQLGAHFTGKEVSKSSILLFKFAQPSSLITCIIAPSSISSDIVEPASAINSARDDTPIRDKNDAISVTASHPSAIDSHASRVMTRDCNSCTARNPIQIRCKYRQLTANRNGADQKVRVGPLYSFGST